MTNLYKADASIATSQMLENPSDSINPTVGMKKPGAMPRKKKKYKVKKDMNTTTTLKNMVLEGDFVMGMTKEGMIHGMVEHIMTEGGTLGTPGSEYALESMPPENPAMSVRIYEEEDGGWEETAYSIGMMYKDAEVVDMSDHSMEDYEEDSEMAMAMYDAQIGKQAPCWDGYVQRGMKPGADGSPVPNCVPAAKLDEMFSNFGKDYSKPTQINEIFKGIGVGSMVSWNSSGGRAEGKITRIIRSGSYKVPGTSVSVNGTEEDPAAVIRLYRDGKATDTIVAHKIKTLRSK